MEHRNYHVWLWHDHIRTVRLGYCCPMRLHVGWSYFQWIGFENRSVFLDARPFNDRVVHRYPAVYIIWQLSDRLQSGIPCRMDRKRTGREEMGLELNPDFQRGHVWTEQQQIAFLEYL